ncbi:MAG: DMT family transporter [Alphaproteobacteria bacterium]
MSQSRAHIEMALALITLGINLAMSKWIANLMAPGPFALVRFASAVPVLFVLALYMDKTTPTRMLSSLKRDWKSFIVLGLVGVVFYTLFLLEGAKRTTVLDAGLISAAMPIFVVFWALVLLRVKPSAKGWIAVILAVAGLLVLNWQPDGKLGQGLLIGNLLVLAAFSSEAFFIIKVKQLSERVGPLELGFWMHLSGLLLTIPYVLIHDVLGVGGTPIEWATLWPAEPLFLPVAAFYIFTASVLSVIFFNRAIPLLSPQVSAVYSVIVPLTAALLAWIVWQEQPTGLDSLAFIMLIIAIILVAFAEKPNNIPNNNS